MRSIETNHLQPFVNNVIDHTLSEKRIVGTVVQIAKKGNVVFSRAAGLADREQQRVMQEDALFRYAYE